MIAKERTIPLRLIKLEGLLKRLPINHPKRPLIEQDLAKRKAGFSGEKASDYYVHKLPEKDFIIFHDLRLQNGSHFFQIDTLILHPTFALILEIKNIKGTIYFDSTFKQLIRFSDNNEEGFLDPISQADRQKNELRKWLETINISLPMEYLVVISNPSTIIKTNEQNYEAMKRVLHAHKLIDRIATFKKKYNFEGLATSELSKIKRNLIKKHVPEQINILGVYKIPEVDIVTGIQCPSCSSCSMLRQFGTWACPVCKHKDKSAHKLALLDYLLLFNSSISNQQFRDFLRLSSIDTPKYLLKSMDLPYSGLNKGRVYHLDTLLSNEITQISK